MGWSLRRFLQARPALTRESRPGPPNAVETTQTPGTVAALRARDAHTLTDAEFKVVLAAEHDEERRHGRASVSIHRSEYLSPADEARHVVVGDDGLPNLRLVRERGQLVLMVPHGMVNPRSTALYRLGIYTFRARGASYHEDAVAAASLTPGTALRLVREPENEFDPNAIALYAVQGSAPIGYVNRLNAARIAKVLDASTNLVAITVSGGPKGSVGDPVGVLVTTPVLLEHLRRARP
jgi:hypothetical protein